MIKSKASSKSKAVGNLEKRVEGLLFLLLAAAVLTVFLTKKSMEDSTNNVWSLTTQYTLESIIDDVTGAKQNSTKEAPPQPELGN